MFQQKAQAEEAESWISVSDLMAGLMVFFLFIAILYIQPLQRIKINVEDILSAWENGEQSVLAALQKEFEADLEGWGAEIDEELLSIRFDAPDVLFNQGSSDVSSSFKYVLDDFFPRYLSVLEPFTQEGIIEEIRIEGHTSTEWRINVTEQEAYFRNLKLSQDRTRAVLIYSLSIPKVAPYLEWARDLITANGLSSSRLITHSDGSENRQRSRRVEFRIKTRTEQRLKEIATELGAADD